MSHYNDTPAVHSVYLDTQMRWYRQECRVVLEILKKYFRGDDTDKVEIRINYPLFVINKLLKSARAHFSNQAIMLGSSNHDASCAMLVAPSIGLDLQPDLSRLEVSSRIDRLIAVLDKCNDGDFPEDLWARVALLSSLRAISSATD